MKIEHSMLIWFHISDVFSTFFFSVFKQHKSRIQVDCKWRAIMPLYFLCFSVALPSYSLPPLFFQSPVINDRAEIKPSKASHWANTGKQLWAEHRLKLNGTFYESSVNHATRLKTCKNTSLGLNATWGTIKGTYTDGTLFLGKVLAVVDGKALLMVSNQSARSEVFFFFFNSLTQHVVKKGTWSLHNVSAFLLLSRWMGRYIMSCVCERKRNGDMRTGCHCAVKPPDCG